MTPQHLPVLKIYLQTFPHTFEGFIPDLVCQYIKELLYYSLARVVCIHSLFKVFEVLAAIQDRDLQHF